MLLRRLPSSFEMEKNRRNRDFAENVDTPEDVYK